MAAFQTNLPGGAVDGYGRQVGLQIVGALFIIGWNLVWTSLILLFIKYALRVPLRMSEEQLLVGDFAVHGEEPYVFGEPPASLGYNRGEKGDLEAGVILGRTPNDDPNMIGAPVPHHHAGTTSNALMQSELDSNGKTDGPKTD